ncbi:MAG: hypothetical protein ACTSPY_10420 [Candidatus Helarchaeota archaeon]
MTEDDIIEKKTQFKSTRIDSFKDMDFDPLKPRLGRRESEPHSEEVSYIYEVLMSNFPNSRTLWDLHHYFQLEDIEIDIQFDISFFLNWTYPYALSSYKASKFNNRVPDLVINILSKSTWRSDIGEHVDYCENLKIPIYIVYSSFYNTSKFYKPPFLRIYKLKGDKYEHFDLREITLVEGGEVNSKFIMDLGEKTPFRIGIMLRKRKFEGNEPLYRLVIIDKDKDKVLSTRYELQKQVNVQLEHELEQAKQTKSKLEHELEQAKQIKSKLEQKIRELEKLLQKYHV